MLEHGPARESPLEPMQKARFSRVIGKFLTTVERRGWVVDVDEARDYIEVAEGMQGSGERWEEGRAALRWLEATHVSDGTSSQSGSTPSTQSRAFRRSRMNPSVTGNSLPISRAFRDAQ
jgi:hypothetical protein